MKFISNDNSIVKELDESLLNLSKDDELVKELTKTHYKYDEPSWYFIDENHSFNNAVKIKVNIKDVGYVIIYFDQSFDKALKKEMVYNILNLKDIDVNESYESLKNKLYSMFSLFNEHQPYFGVFIINNYHEEVERILFEIEGMNYPLYYVNEEPEVKEEAVQEEAVKEEKKEEKGIAAGFKKSLKNIVKYKVEHLFNALYSLLIAVCALLACVYLDNNNKGVGILFICFAILFIGLIAYNLHLYGLDNKGITLYDYTFFVGFSLISLVLGMLIGYLLVKSLVKFGDNPINYSKNIKIAILISIPSLAAAHGLRFLITFLYKKIKGIK